MSEQPVPRIEIDGRAASAEQLRQLALHTYGHFTAMQVRAGRVRGWAAHLDRLGAANREMFGAELDGDRIRDHVRHALGDDITDASVRVIVYLSDDDVVCVMVTVRPPAEPPSTPHRLRSVPYLRPLPHLKQVGGGFGQNYHRRAAHREGYTEALLTGPDGVIAEGGISNVGFFDGTTVIWPDAPALIGITMRLLETHLPHGGLASRRAPVRLADLPSFDAVFLTSSRGIAPVERVDDLTVPIDPTFMKAVADVYESVPWDRI
jgi:branched-subunit amino acid aminotransferase/4-amino-4-deoxychorismate lyase